MTTEINIFSFPSQLTKILEKNFKDRGASVRLVEFPSEINFDNYKSSISYNIFVFDKINIETLSQTKNLIDRSIAFAQKSHKSLFVFPYTNPKEVEGEIENWKNHILNSEGGVFGILLLGDPVLNETPLDFNFFDLSWKEGKRTIYFPADVGWMAEEVFRLVFSMNAYGVKTALIGNELVKVDFQENQKEDYIIGKFENVIRYQSQITIKKDNDSEKLIEETETPKPNILVDPKQIIPSNEFDWVTTKAVPDIKKKTNLKSYKKIVLGSVALMFILVLLPIALYFSSKLLFYASNFDKLILYPSVNQKIIYSSEKLSKASVSISEQIGIKKLLDDSNNLLGSITLNKQLNDVNLVGLQLLKEIVGESDNVMEKSKEATIVINHLRNNISLLSADEEKSNRFEGNSILKKSQLRVTLKALNLLKNVTENVPIILGSKETRRYVVAIGDSNYPLGSGGKIQNLIIFEVNNAEFGNVMIIDPYKLDLKLKGSIEAPGKFLELTKKDKFETAFSFWNSDFSEGSNNLIRFITNAMDISVDGVVYISDSKVAQLAKYGRVKENGFEYLRDGDVKDEETVVNAIEALTDKNNYKNNKLVAEIYDSIIKKEILIYFNDFDFSGIDVLDVSGSMVVEDCGTNCYSDLLELITISLGEGGKNTHKEVDLKISFEEGFIKKRLTIFVSNFNDFDYKYIAKILSNQDSGFSPVSLVTKERKDMVEGIVGTVNGFKENSVEAKVEPNGTGGVSFYWEQPIDELEHLEKYQLKIIKQPGSGEIDLSLDLNSSSEYKIITPEYYSLTEEGGIDYNTKLISNLELEFELFK